MSSVNLNVDEPPPSSEDEGITSDDAQVLLRIITSELNRLSLSTFSRAAHSLTGGSAVALHAIKEAKDQLRIIQTKLEKLI